MIKYFLPIVLTVMLLTAGCGEKNENAGSTGDNNKSETKTDFKSETKNENPDIKKSEEVTPESTGDAQNKANELGMTPGLPKDFPADVPLPKNSKTLGSLNSSEGTVVTFESKDKVQDIVNFFKEEMKKNGYAVKESEETIISDKGGLINWTKEKSEVGLMLGYDKDKDITSLVITYK